MANTYTTRFSLTKPEVGADTNAWGGHLNANLDTIDLNMVSLTLTTTQTMVGALALPANGLNVGSGQLQVAGGNVSTSGNVSGVNGSFSGTLGVTGAATLSSTLAVTGSATFSSTMSVTGAVTASTAPTVGGHLTNKTYVDAQDALKLNLTGGTLTGNLSIVNSTTEMTLTLGSSGGYYYGNATTAGFKNSGGTNRVSWNISTGDFTAAGNVTASTGVVSDTISECTSGVGVTIDGVLLKDSLIGGVYRPITSATAQATTSGTSINFGSIPSWVKRISIIVNDVSFSASESLAIQIGPSGGVETSGYLGTNIAASGGAVVSFSTDFRTGAFVSTTIRGILTLNNVSGNIWILAGNISVGTSNLFVLAGSKTLAGVLTQVTLKSLGGVNTFTAGSINIFYE